VAAAPPLVAVAANDDVRLWLETDGNDRARLQGMAMIHGCDNCD